MMNHKKKIVMLAGFSALACILSISAATFATKIGNRSSATATECEHTGNHYSYLAPTDSASGVREYWVCCECHEHYLTKPSTGTWAEAGTPKVISDPTDDRYLAKGPSCIDVVAGWTTEYDLENGYFSYKNTTNNAFRMFSDLSISGKGILTFDYYNRGLGCTDGSTQVSNWLAGLLLSAKLDVSKTSGPFMAIGKTCGGPKRITGIAAKDDGTISWNLHSGTDIVVEDGVKTRLSIAYDIPNHKLTITGNNCISTMNIPASLQSADKLYLGLYGSSMKTGYDYGEVSISNIIDIKDEPTYVDSSAGWASSYDNANKYLAFTNNTAGAVRSFPSLSISGKGTISYNYYEKGIGYNGSAQISNWVAGLMLSKVSDPSTSKGPYMVIGKTPMVAKRITSVTAGDNGAVNAWNNPTGTNITFEDGEWISLTLNYDLTAGTVSATSGGKTSNFNLPATLQGLETLYLGLYGSTMTGTNPYGQVVISNLVITPEALA